MDENDDRWALRSDEAEAFVRDRDGNACRHCGSKVNTQIDHVIPRWHLRQRLVPLLVQSATWNLQVLCEPCNTRKGSSIPSPREVLEVCEAEAAYVLSLQQQVEEACSVLRHPLMEEFADSWQCVADACRRSDDPGMTRDLPPGDWWREDLAPAIEAGVTPGAMYMWVIRSNMRADRDAWEYCRSLIKEWVRRQGETGAVTPYERAE